VLLPVTTLIRHAIAVSALCAGLSSSASAQSYYGGPSTDDATGSSLLIGLRLGFGQAQAAAPADEDPEDALLFGSAFVGSQFRGAASLTYLFSPLVGFRTELGLNIGRLSGFAEDDTFRRELQFNVTALDVPALLQVGGDLGAVSLYAHAGLQARASLSVAGRDIRSGNVPGDPPVIQVRTAPSFGAALGGGLAFDAGPGQIPLEFRYFRSLTYPRGTADRLDEVSDAGRYWIDATWTVVVSTGFDFGIGGGQVRAQDSLPREPRAPRPARQRRERTPAYVPPPAPAPPQYIAPPVAQPDQDADGFPDALDACPIEPSDTNAGPESAGCPLGGGIVTLSCELVTLSMPVEFYTGSWDLDPASYPMLYLVADTLNVAQNVRVLSIEGHTDDRGDADENQMLSEDRAYIVMDFLIEAGVDPARLQAVGYGEEFPVADNATPEGRTANRRVEFRIVSNDTCGF